MEKKKEAFNFRKHLQQLNQEYINSSYDKWVKEHNKYLKTIKELMQNAARQGSTYYDIMLGCNKNKHDEEYYEKYLKSLGLDVKISLKPKIDVEECRLMFSISWK